MQEHNSHKLQSHPTVVQIASQLTHSSGAPVTPTQVLLRCATPRNATKMSSIVNTLFIAFFF